MLIINRDRYDVKSGRTGLPSLQLAGSGFGSVGFSCVGPAVNEPFMNRVGPGLGYQAIKLSSLPTVWSLMGILHFFYLHMIEQSSRKG